MATLILGLGYSPAEQVCCPKSPIRSLSACTCSGLKKACSCRLCLPTSHHVGSLTSLQPGLSTSWWLLACRGWPALTGFSTTLSPMTTWKGRDQQSFSQNRSEVSGGGQLGILRPPPWIWHPLCQHSQTLRSTGQPGPQSLSNPWRDAKTSMGHHCQLSIFPFSYVNRDL